MNLPPLPDDLARLTRASSILHANLTGWAQSSSNPSPPEIFSATDVTACRSESEDLEGDHSITSDGMMSVQLSQRFPYQALSIYGRRKKILGEGSFSTVYLYKNGPKKYALKRVRFDEDNAGESIDGLEIPQFLLREVTSMVWLQHPNVIRLLDIVISLNNCYLVMPLAQGTLLDLMRKQLTLRERQNYAYQIARGTAYCIENQVWNRDLKPGNILYFQDPDNSIRLVLTDFGLAKTNLAGTTPEYFTDEVYSLWYRAPEILLDLEYDAAAEVWAFGCILAELYLGRPMCRAGTKMGQLLELFRMFGTPTPLTWPDLPNVGTWDMPHYFGNPYLWVAPDTDPHGLDLLQRTLVLNPKQRLTIQQVLQHPYFYRVARKIERRFPISTPDVKPGLPPSPSLDSITNLRKEAFFGHLAKLLIQAEPESPFYQSYRVYFLSLILFNAVASDLGVTEANLELIGLACFDLAQKFIITEWIFFEDLTAVTLTSYRKDDVIAMQLEILKRRSWDLNMMTPFDAMKLSSAELHLRPLIMGLLFYASCTQLFDESDPMEIFRVCSSLVRSYHSKPLGLSIEIPSWFNQPQNSTFADLFEHIAEVSISDFRAQLSGVPVVSPNGKTRNTAETADVEAAENNDIGEIDEAGDQEKIDETGELEEIDETGELEEIDETGDQEIDGTGDPEEIDETGDQEIDGAGDPEEIDGTGDQEKIDEIGDQEKIDEAGDQEIDETGDQEIDETGDPAEPTEASETAELAKTSDTGKTTKNIETATTAEPAKISKNTETTKT